MNPSPTFNLEPNSADYDLMKLANILENRLNKQTGGIYKIPCKTMFNYCKKHLHKFNSMFKIVKALNEHFTICHTGITLTVNQGYYIVYSVSAIATNIPVIEKLGDLCIVQLAQRFFGEKREPKDGTQDGSVTEIPK